MGLEGLGMGWAMGWGGWAMGWATTINLGKRPSGAGRGGTRMCGMAAASAHLPFLTPLTLDSAVDSSLCVIDHTHARSQPYGLIS